jgi:acyl carrier protein
MSARPATETEGRLRAFIVDELLDQPFDGDDPLAEGAVDSLGIEQLIDYIDQTFGVELDDDEAIYENFESLPALASAVEAKVLDT